MLNLKFFCFLLSTLKERILLHVYKYWFAPENLLWVGALRLNINYPEFRRYHHTCINNKIHNVIFLNFNKIHNAIFLNFLTR